MKHTHTGHCQACGRIQAVHIERGTIAKHGYKKGHGYFQGTCQGSDYPPLQIDTARNTEFRKGCLTTAERCERDAAELKAGNTFPLSVNALECNGNRKYAKAQVWGGMRTPILIAWADANERERERGLTAAILDAERTADFMRSHEKDLATLAARIHGTELIEVQS